MLGGRLAFADAINFTTGNVEVDMPDTNAAVHVTKVDSDPLDSIFQMPEMQSNGNNLINGYAIKDIRTYYDFSTDKLYVGVNAYSIAGTAVGADGAQGAAMDQILQSHGGSDPAHLGGDKSITLAFIGTSPNSATTQGQTIMVAGVPADKSAANPAGTDGFTVASYKGATTLGIQNNYGSILTSNQGQLAFDPSSSHPDFEFTINNFSKISPSLDPTKGYFIQAYAGSAQDGPIGEEVTQAFHVPAVQPQNFPEPSTWLGWSIIVGGSLHQLRRRGKK